MFQNFNGTVKASSTYEDDAETGSNNSRLSTHSSQFNEEYKGNTVNFSIRFPSNDKDSKTRNMNQLALLIATIFYAVFGVIEFYAGDFSNSLALQADSINCFVDAATYLMSYVVEGFKISNEGVELSYEVLFIVEILLPAISTFVLLGYMIYFMVEAILVLVHPSTHPEVDMHIVIWFSVINLLFNAIICPMTLYSDDGKKGCSCNPEDINISEELVLTASIEGGVGSKTPRSARADHGNASQYQNVNLIERWRSSNEFRNPSTVRSHYSENSNFVSHDDEPHKVSSKFSAYSVVSDGPDGSVHVVRSKIDEKNYNMISAILHILGDMIMATGELVAALVAQFSKVSAPICDASAAVLTCSLVLSLSIYMLFDLYEAYERLNKRKLEVVDESIHRKLQSDLESEAE